MSDHVSISAVDCGEALGHPNSNITSYFGQGGEEAQVDKEGNIEDDLVDHEMDPYEEAMHDHPNGSIDTFFYSNHHNRGPNVP